MPDTPTETTDRWFIDFLDDLHRADLYMDRIRSVLWFAMLGYIICHVLGFAP